MKTIWCFDLGKVSADEAVRAKTIPDVLGIYPSGRAIPRKCRRAKLSLRSSEKKTLLGFRPNSSVP